MVDKQGIKRNVIGLRQDKEKEEINAAVLEYLIKQGYNETANQFKEEAKVSIPDKQTAGMSDLLEKKWASVVRLKK